MATPPNQYAHWQHWCQFCAGSGSKCQLRPVFSGTCTSLQVHMVVQQDTQALSTLFSVRSRYDYHRSGLRQLSLVIQYVSLTKRPTGPWYSPFFQRPGHVEQGNLQQKPES